MDSKVGNHILFGGYLALECFGHFLGLSRNLLQRKFVGYEPGTSSLKTCNLVKDTLLLKYFDLHLRQ